MAYNDTQHSQHIDLRVVGDAISGKFVPTHQPHAQQLLIGSPKRGYLTIGNVTCGTPEIMVDRIVEVHFPLAFVVTCDLNAALVQLLGDTYVPNVT